MNKKRFLPTLTNSLARSLAFTFSLPHTCSNSFQKKTSLFFQGFKVTPYPYSYSSHPILSIPPPPPAPPYISLLFSPHRLLHPPSHSSKSSNPSPYGFHSCPG